ncbi:dolichyl-P-Glc:Glc(2)Man(9)GlcNAc(2)-PP-dolichol alpha-1,2- glucosyltransferase [Sporobolomyces koalae]|uniref:dolichyl-P-Glc:Glc(2)Man(9)GlcNAc(2)-PP-dolichol alpha-1,2- glucosyltransferase n=1 Tax=Sporobolomyces koalae TaxID=500713 RepID=UPI00317C718F
MGSRYGILYWPAYAVWVVGLLGVARRINQEVPEPYMDEIFHMPQAQAYCRGEWSYWDTAITTPPGLYLVPAVLSRLLSQVAPAFSAWPCSLDALRFFNLILLAFLPMLYTALLVSIQSATFSLDALRLKSRKKAHRAKQIESARWEGLVIALMPVVGWWAWLYYTDLGSVMTVLASYKLSLDKRYLKSSLLGALSLLFRQTNIVWIAFIAGLAIVTRLRESSENRLYDPLLSAARPIDLVRTPCSVIHLSLFNLRAISRIVLAYLPIFIGFLLFVVLNGGIVLGDKSNHQVTLHVVQVYYFIAFSAVFTSPLLVGPSPSAAMKRIKKTLAMLTGSPMRLLASIVVMTVMAWTVRHFTIAHAFLLADNRHYSFYLWRRIINLNPVSRYLLVPGYLFAATLIYRKLVDSHHMRVSSLVLFTVSTILVLVPTPLIEPRYFLVPFLILRLHLSPSALVAPDSNPSHARRKTALSSRQWKLVLEAGLYVIVHLTTLWLFLEKSFEWTWDPTRTNEAGGGGGAPERDPRELGKKQRFMW